MTDNTFQYELKIQALLERVSELTTQYENKVADLRVELTVTANQLSEASAKLLDATNDKAKGEGIPVEVSEED